jgi:hypothetical protein
MRQGSFSLLWAMLTVVIQTCNRPEMLRDALFSISGQTKLDCIDKIIVSENGGNPESGSVCDSFSVLPIEYVLQDPPLPISDHLVSLQGRVATPFTALLHDDDWWLPDHVESCLLGLQATQSIASFANFSEAGSTLHPLTSSYKAPRIWAATGFDFSRNQIAMSYVQNFLVCLLDSTYHFSTCIGDSEAFWLSICKAISSNPYDCDRTFPIFLGELGSVVYSTKVSAVVRAHPGQDSLRPIYHEEGGFLKAKTTETLAIFFPAAVREAALLFNEILVPGLNDQEFEGMMAYLPWEQKHALSSICGLYGRQGQPLTEIGFQPRSTTSPLSFSQRVIFNLKCRLRPILYGAP